LCRFTRHIYSYFITDKPPGGPLITDPHFTHSRMTMVHLEVVTPFRSRQALSNLAKHIPQRRMCKYEYQIYDIKKTGLKLPKTHKIPHNTRDH